MLFFSWKTIMNHGCLLQQTDFIHSINTWIIEEEETAIGGFSTCWSFKGEEKLGLIIF
jgi:hypothetical protein